jgi:arsenate reductase-like glutaredoxin family protein
VDVKKTTDAKAKLGSEDALKLARQAAKVLVAKGRKVTIFDMRRDAPGDETLLKHILGPTGNLRAPTIRRGKSLLVGFNEQMYAETLG